MGLDLASGAASAHPCFPQPLVRRSLTTPVKDGERPYTKSLSLVFASVLPFLAPGRFP